MTFFFFFFLQSKQIMHFFSDNQFLVVLANIIFAFTFIEINSLKLYVYIIYFI